MTRLLGPLIFLAVLGATLGTVCGSYDLVDGAELIGAGMTLGVAHPPGYPLATLGGRLIGVLPLGSPALRLNLVGPLAAGLAAAAAFALGRRVGVPAAGMALGGLVGFHASVWEQAAGIKGGVYLGLLAAMIFTLSRAFAGTWLKAMLAGGLCAAWQAQGGIVLLTSLGAMAAGESMLAGRWRPRAVVLALLWVLVGLSPYLYLPIRSAAFPDIAWGAWHRLEGVADILRWSLARAGRVHGGMGLAEAYPHKALMLGLLAAALAGNALGMTATRRASPWFAGALAGAGTFLVLLPIDIHAKYFQHGLPMWAGGIAGLLGAIVWLRTRAARAKAAAIAVAAAVALLSTGRSALDRASLDWSRYYAADDLVRNVAGSLPDRPHVLICIGDFSYDAIRLGQALQVRMTDVAVARYLMLRPGAYGDQLGNEARRLPWFQPPGSRLEKGVTAGRVAREIADAAHASRPVYADPYFFGIGETLAWSEGLNARSRGFAVAFTGAPQPGSALRRLTRGRYRGMWELRRFARDRWNRFLPSMYMETLGDTLRPEILSGRASSRRSRAVRLAYRLGMDTR